MHNKSIEPLFRQGVEHHQAGRLAQAEQLYRQVLVQQPEHASALHYLGVIAHQVGRNDLAVELIRQSLMLTPDDYEAHNNLGEILRTEGRLDEAIAACGQALAVKPDSAEAHNNLGNALKDNGQLDAAIAAYRQAIAVKGDYADAHNNLGNALKDKGQLDEAIAAYRHAIALRADFPGAHNNLGVSLRNKGQLDEAITAYRRAIALKADVPEAHNNLGIALNDKGQLDEAIAACRRAIFLRPNYPEAHNNLGVILTDKGQPDAAIAAYRQAITLDRDYPEAHNNLGVVLKDKGQLNEAIATYRRAIALKPKFHQAYNNLGSALKDQGRLNEALGAYRQAIAIDPGFTMAHSNLVYSLYYHPDWNARAIFAEARRYDELHAQPLTGQRPPHTNDPEPDRKVRIGYVSPDFRYQAECYFVVPLIAAHDHRQFEIHCYSSVRNPDEMTRRHRAAADVWHDVPGLTDEQLAEKIREDRIDILVDLTMHMANNRLPVFARKPAPVQITWLAYPGTTGLTAIDYRITDAYMDEPGADESCYSEMSVRLPGCWCCYQPLTQTPVVAPVPSAAGLPITFGSLNNFCKMNSQVLALWQRVLTAVPNSRLLLLCPEDEERQVLAEEFEIQGISRDRVIFIAARARDSYLATYDQIDIALDPFPYNGITTTCDALWMGVPVLTLIGRMAHSRAGLSMLSTVGLPELAAQTEDDFIHKAIALARDLPHLEQLRSTLRERMIASPLMDGPRFAKDMESAYRQMWRMWCAKQNR